MSGEVKDYIDVKELKVSDNVVGDISWSNANGPAIFDEAASSTNPTLIPDKSDPDTGIGQQFDNVILVSGGITAMQFLEASSKILQQVQSSGGLTADNGSSQGDGVILSSYNIYDTVAGAGDAATLPAVAGVGTMIYIKNGAAANSMDVFPASGDDLGAGANTQRALAAKDFVVYICTTTNSVWEELMRGTCSA